MHVLWHSVNELATCNACQLPVILNCLISRCAKRKSTCAVTQANVVVQLMETRICRLSMRGWLVG